MAFSCKSINRVAATVLVGAGTLWLAACGGNDEPPPDPAVVTTTSGPLRGSVDATTKMFLGIPYAAPPVGARRWQPPQATDRWTVPRDAMVFASPCAQPTRDAQGRPAVLGAEDCLYLNVVAPIDAARLPVLVFVHGGAFRNGAGSDFDASALSVKGRVVVVTINYRLGVFGFLAHPGLAQESVDGASGQYGLLDQRFALEWIRREIAGFGGDPSNVTLAGQSSGAFSVCNQLASPPAAGLFHKAIMQSGACSSASGSLPQAQAEAAGVSFSQGVGCAAGAVTTCLRALGTAELANAPATERIGSNLGWAPALGGTTLPRSSADALRAGAVQQVPVLVGTNREDYRLFVALQEVAQGAPISSAQYLGLVNGAFGPGAAAVLSTYPLSAYAAPNLAQAALFTDLAFACPAATTANLFSSRVETYAYEFDDPTAPTQVPDPFLEQRAYHGAELLYLFRQPMSAFGFGPAAALNANQQSLADQLIAYWAAFARTGKPADPALPAWPRYSQTAPAVQRLAPGAIGTTASLGVDHRCGFWASFGV